MPSIALQIDGRTITCEAGQTILQAARRAGIFIPNLCHHDELPSVNACNLCVVEIDRRDDCPTACTTAVAQDMVVQTDTPRLLELRYQALGQMLNHHPDPCMLCDTRDDCEQYRAAPGQKSAEPFACTQRPGMKVGGMLVDLSRLALERKAADPRKIQSGDPFIARDYNYCVTCGLCWRACETVQSRPRPGGQTTEWASRIKALGEKWTECGCTFCGTCVDVCPAGALVDRYAHGRERSAHQPVTNCTICPQGCPIKAILSAGQLVATMLPRLDHASRLCAAGRFAYARLLNDPDRLKTPMIRVDEELAEVDWDQALEVIGKCLEPYRDGSFVAIIGQTETRENALMYELFAKNVMRGQVVRFNAETRGATLELLDREIRAGNVRAAIVSGNYLDVQTCAELEYLVAADFRYTRACDIAEAVLPVAILSELEGTTRTADGGILRLKKVVEPPGSARAEWTFLSELAAVMGSDLLGNGDFKPNGPLVGETTRVAHPRDTLADLPTTFRGHQLADIVTELRVFGMPFTPDPPGSTG